jgi:hypothetical protein
MRLSLGFIKAARRDAAFFVAVEAKSRAHYHHQTEESTSTNRGAGTRRLARMSANRNVCVPWTKAAIDEG